MSHYVNVYRDKSTKEVMYISYSTIRAGSGGKITCKGKEVDVKEIEFKSKEKAKTYRDILIKRYQNIGEAELNTEMKIGGEETLSLLPACKRKIRQSFPDGQSYVYDSINQVHRDIRYNFRDISLSLLNHLLENGEPFSPTSVKHSRLMGMKLEYIEEPSPRIIILSGVDRSGKDTLINEIDKQTKYKHMTMDRGPSDFIAYCDIFEKGEELKRTYECMERTLSANGYVLGIYVDCSTEELIRRSIETNHEIIDFDYHKKVTEFYFDESSLRSKVKVDTTKTSAKDIVRDLIERGIL